MILDEIVAYKRVKVAQRQRELSLSDLQDQCERRPPALDLAAALRQPGVGLIAEVKKASPSRGLLCPDFDPCRLAADYAAGGASAISVLTDRHFFQGDGAYLDQIRQELARRNRPLPLLRKDFIVSSFQVFESRALGADALLLIAAVLEDDLLRELLDLTHELGMQALVEVHDRTELERVLLLNPRIVGINNRNLRDFSVDLDTFGRLHELLPLECVSVAESGVRNPADVRRLAAMGADAVLVGEALVTAPDTTAMVRDLVAGGQP